MLYFSSSTLSPLTLPTQLPSPMSIEQQQQPTTVLPKSPPQKRETPVTPGRVKVTISLPPPQPPLQHPLKRSRPLLRTLFQLSPNPHHSSTIIIVVAAAAVAELWIWKTIINTTTIIMRAIIGSFWLRWRAGWLMRRFILISNCWSVREAPRISIGSWKRLVKGKY